jgi:hypothetical protein
MGTKIAEMKPAETGFCKFANNLIKVINMTYSETVEYLFSLLPAYHRIGKPAYKGNLDNTLALDRYFGHPHKKSVRYMLQEQMERDQSHT